MHTQYTINIHLTADEPELMDHMVHAVHFGLDTPKGVTHKTTTYSNVAHKKQERMKAILDILTGADFEEFSDEFGPLMSFVNGDSGGPSKELILEKIEQLFKRIV